MTFNLPMLRSQNKCNYHLHTYIFHNLTFSIIILTFYTPNIVRKKAEVCLKIFALFEVILLVFPDALLIKNREKNTVKYLEEKTVFHWFPVRLLLS